VYNVNPLTYTQLYYIFNFGSLSTENEKKYFTEILEAEVGEYVKENKILEKVKELMILAFTTSQTFIKTKKKKNLLA